MNCLKTTELCRYIQSAELKGTEIRFPFRDEIGKTTVAKYKLVEILESNISVLYNYIWRLDGRSVRHMKRVKIIENFKKGIKRTNGSIKEDNRPSAK